MNRIGADLVVESIKAHGNKTVFTLGGAQHYRLLDVLDRNGVRIIGGRHETAVVAAADGYSRASGRAGVAIVIADQGVANAYAGLITAAAACSPLVLLVARFPIAYDDPQAEEVSQFVGLRDVVKWACTVPSEERLGEYVDAAFRIAEAGRAGPVVVGVQSDFLDAAVSDWTPEARQALATKPCCSPAEFADIADLVVSAKRPMIIGGAGARFGNASPALTRIAEDFGIPVVGRGLGRGLVDESTDAGWSWTHGLGALQEADLVLAVGARVNQKMNYGLPPRFDKNVKLVQVNTAAEDLGSPRNVSRTVIADAGKFSEGLYVELAGRKAKTRDLSWVAAAGEQRRSTFASIGSNHKGRPHPAETARQTSRRLPHDAIVVADGANFYGWLQGVHDVHTCPGWMDHSPLGSMGIGTGLSIGAAAAAGDEAAATGTTPRQVLLFTGDGAMGYFISEFSTMSRHGLPILTVVGNDGAWGTERHGQLVSLGRTVNTELGRWDYARAAASFGCRSRTVVQHDKLEETLDWAFDFSAEPSRPAVINVEIDEDAGAEMKTDKTFAVLTFHALVNPNSGIYPKGAPTVPIA